MTLLKLGLGLLSFTLLTFNASAQFAGGSGTVEDPYQISTIVQLQEIQNHLDKHFIQINDIDASETVEWNDGLGFAPIGDVFDQFIGSYVGNEYSINNITINRPESVYTGIWGYIKNAELRNIEINNALIIGSQRTGMIVGYSEYSDLSYLHADGVVKSDDIAGGLIGYNESSPLSYSSANIDTSYSNIGGLVGTNSNSDIYRSWTSGKFRGGGLIGGENSRSAIEESFSTATLLEGSGLVGEHVSGTIRNSFYLGTILNGSGLIGWINTNGNVRNVYSVAFDGSKISGGLIRRHGGSIFNGYWDVESSNQPLPISFGTGRNAQVSGLRTKEMQGNSAIKNMSEFDWENVWAAIPNDYPKLLWSIPYSAIETTTYSPTITSGQLFSLETSIKNKGGLKDTTDLILKDSIGTVIDIVENIILESEEEASFTLKWQSNEEAAGFYTFTLETDLVVDTIRVEVLSMPATVELDTPLDSLTDVSLLPTLDWKEASLAEAYHLQIAEDEAFDSIIVEVDDLGNTNYTLTDSLDYLSQYYWRVKATSSIGDGEWSDIRSFTTIIEAPEVVQLSSPANDSTDIPIQPEFTWLSSERAETYQIQISEASSFDVLLQDSSGIETNALNLNELNYNTTYYWRVKAFNAGGESDWSDTWSFFTEYALDTPELVSPSVGLVDISVPVRFEWKPVDGAKDYYLEISKSADFSSVLGLKDNNESELTSLQKSISGKTLAFKEWNISQVVEDLEFETEYYWRVKAQNEVGVSDWSTVKSFTTQKAPVEGLVTLSSPANNSDDVEFPVELSWQAFDEAEGYDVEVSDSPAFDTTFAIKNLDATTFSPTQLTDTTTYYWRVRATVDEQQTAWSETWEFETELRIPEVPVWTPSDQEENISETPLLSWGSSTRASKYHLQLSTDENFTDLIIDKEGIDSTSFQITEKLDTGSIYYWHIRAGNESGYSDWSETLQFSTILSTSNEFQSKPVEFTLQQNFPNPFNPTTSILYGIPEATEVHISVYNMLGQEVIRLVDERKSAGWHTVTLDASQLSSGFYIYRINAKNFSSTKKMVLIK